MDAYDRCTNLEKKIADIVAIYGGDRELFRPPTQMTHLKIGSQCIFQKQQLLRTEM
jgi:hypothetical protein